MTKDKDQSKQWKHLGSPPLKEAKTGMSAGMVMASFFWGAEGVLLVDYVYKRSVLPLRQCSGTHVHSGYGCYLEMWIPTCPELAPSDYYFFPKMKKELGGHHFARDDDVMNAVDQFLRDQNGVPEGIRLLHDHWTKCVNVGGDYVKKWLYLIF